MAKRVLVDFDRLAYNRYLHRYDKEWLEKHLGLWLDKTKRRVIL